MSDPRDNLPSNAAVRAIASAEWQRMPSRQSRVIVLGTLLDALAADEQTLIPELENKGASRHGHLDVLMELETALAQYVSYKNDIGGARDENIYKNLTHVFHRTAEILFDENTTLNPGIEPAKNIVRAALAFEEAAKPSRPERSQEGKVHALYKRSPFGLYMAANELLSHCLQKIDKKWPDLIDKACDQNSRVTFYRNFCEGNRNAYNLLGSLPDMRAGLITQFYEDMHDMAADTTAFIKAAAEILPTDDMRITPHFRALREISAFLQPYAKPSETPPAERRDNIVSMNTYHRRHRKGPDDFRF